MLTLNSSARLLAEIGTQTIRPFNPQILSK